MQQHEYDRWIAPIQERMVNCVWRIVRDPDDTDDVIQEVLFRVAQRFSAVRRHANPTALLLRTCINAALDHQRRRKPEPLATEALLHVQANADSPDQSLARKERHSAVLAFLRELPEREAEAITLFALEGLEYPEVAQAMGCSKSTVRVLVGRARHRFREAFPSRQLDSPTEKPVVHPPIVYEEKRYGKPGI